MKYPFQYRGDFLLVGIAAYDVSCIGFDIFWKLILRTEKDDRIFGVLDQIH